MAQENNSSCSLGCLILIILVIAFFLVGIWASREGPSWDIAARKNTVDSYQDYLKRHPQGPHTQEARSRLEELLKICPGTDLDWQDVAEIHIFSHSRTEHWQIKGDIGSNSERTEIHAKNGNKIVLERNPFSGSLKDGWLARINEHAPHVKLRLTTTSEDIYQNRTEKHGPYTTDLRSPTTHSHPATR